jgi:hypothetical protein
MIITREAWDDDAAIDAEVPAVAQLAVRNLLSESPLTRLRGIQETREALDKLEEETVNEARSYREYPDSWVAWHVPPRRRTYREHGLSVSALQERFGPRPPQRAVDPPPES